MNERDVTGDREWHAMRLKRMNEWMNSYFFSLSVDIRRERSWLTRLGKSLLHKSLSIINNLYNYYIRIPSLDGLYSFYLSIVMDDYPDSSLLDDNGMQIIDHGIHKS